MSNEPVAWMFQHEETGRMSYVSNDGMNTPSEFLKMNPRYTLVCDLYDNPVDDTALLRQALEVLSHKPESFDDYLKTHSDVITALRARLEGEQ